MFFRAVNILEKLDRSRKLDLLRSQSPMVSVPRSGMQLAEAAYVFDTVLASIGLQEMDSDLKFLSRKVFSGSGKLGCFEINLLTKSEGDEEGSDDDKTTKPSLIANQIMCRLVMSTNPCIDKGQRKLSKIISINVNMESLHQHVDFPLVRLMLQISETLDVIKDEEKYLMKIKNEKSKTQVNHHSSLSTPEHVHTKIWKNMHAVMTLYTNTNSFDKSK